MVEDNFTRLAQLTSFVSKEQRDIPLFEVPLDDDVTEFLDNLETMRQGSMKEYERKIADEEAQHLLSFQAALAAKSSTVQELKQASSVPIIQEQKSAEKKNPPPPKKAKIHQGGSEERTNTTKTPHVDTQNTLEVMKTLDGGIDKSSVVFKTGLVSCSDDSEDD
ncbi:protein FAM192A [Pyrus ussuriensis x Pyrus communis]|uniref:Protein FAM192A n=1 Tax=Pyrus ussuriensis x Pyrus communis TaxID=2448454 RepID=A0A5N5GAQ6_9ROSA|nr:protein FAM192A [Pyrus ussuriensis x Pyrus communis]